MGELLVPSNLPRKAIALWLGNWGTPSEVNRPRVADMPGQDHTFGTWLVRPRGGGEGWQPVEARVPLGADTLGVALNASKNVLGLTPQSASDIGVITPGDLPGAVTEPTMIHSFSTLHLPRPDPSVELGYFPIGALPEGQLNPRFQRWLGPLMVTAFEQ